MSVTINPNANIGYQKGVFGDLSLAISSEWDQLGKNGEWSTDVVAAVVAAKDPKAENAARYGLFADEVNESSTEWMFLVPAVFGNLKYTPSQKQDLPEELEVTDDELNRAFELYKGFGREIEKVEDLKKGKEAEVRVKRLKALDALVGRYWKLHPKVAEAVVELADLDDESELTVEHFLLHYVDALVEEHDGDSAVEIFKAQMGKMLDAATMKTAFGIRTEDEIKEEGDLTKKDEIKDAVEAEKANYIIKDDMELDDIESIEECRKSFGVFVDSLFETLWLAPVEKEEVEIEEGGATKIVKRVKEDSYQERVEKVAEMIKSAKTASETQSELEKNRYFKLTYGLGFDLRAHNKDNQPGYRNRDKVGAGRANVANSGAGIAAGGKFLLKLDDDGNIGLAASGRAGMATAGMPIFYQEEGKYFEYNGGVFFGNLDLELDIHKIFAVQVEGNYSNDVADGNPDVIGAKSAYGLYLGGLFMLEKLIGHDVSLAGGVYLGKTNAKSGTSKDQRMFGFAVPATVYKSSPVESYDEDGDPFSVSVIPSLVFERSDGSSSEIGNPGEEVGEGDFRVPGELPIAPEDGEDVGPAPIEFQQKEDAVGLQLQVVLGGITKGLDLFVNGGFVSRSRATEQAEEEFGDEGENTWNVSLGLDYKLSL